MNPTSRRPFRRTPRQLLAAILTTVLTCTAVTACNPGLSGEELDSITIGYQPGVGYAPLLLVQQEQTLEEKFPDKDFQWQELNSGAALRDGAISGEIHVVAGGVGPFIVGYDSGVPWRVLVALDDANLKLMSTDTDSLSQLQGAGSIALPGPDSIQSIVLRKAASEELGTAGAFDNQMVAMGHPDGMQALLSGQVDAHLTSPPFQETLADEGANTVVESFDVFGEHTFNGVYVLEPFYEGNTAVVDALRDAIADSVDLLRTEPATAAGKLAEVMGDVTAAELEQQITSDDITYATEPRGFMAYAEFMAQIGLIEEVPAAAEDFCYPSELTANCS